MATRDTALCAVKACTREHTKRGQYCHRCRAWTKYWEKRPKTDRYLRHIQVQFWNKRMTEKWGKSDG